METEVDREVRMFVEEVRLQDVSYSGAPGPAHYSAPEGSTPLRIDAVYADPRWVKGVMAGYMVGPDKVQDRKGHCPIMVTVDVKGQGTTRRMSKGRTKKASACRQGSSGRRRGTRGGSSGSSRCTSK